MVSRELRAPRGSRGLGALIAGDEGISLRVASSRRKRNIHLHTAVPCCRQAAAECLEVNDERTLWAGCETATQLIQAPERPEAEQSVRDLGYRESPPVTRSTL